MGTRRLFAGRRNHGARHACTRLSPLCRALSWGLAALPAAAGATEAYEEQLLLRDVPSVFAASGFEQSASDAPSSVSVITSTDIERFGWRTLAEALGSLRGFDTRYDHVYEYVGVRGLQRPGDWNGRILLLVDGHRVNENVYGQALLGHDAVVDLGAVERIEVVRGPGSSLYGASAVLAVVDVITKQGRDYRGLQAQASAGSHGTRSLRVGGGDRVGDLEFSASVSALQRDGARQLYFPALADLTPSAGWSAGADGERHQRLLGTLRWKEWSVQAAAVDWHKALPASLYGTALSDPTNRVRQERAFLRVGWASLLGEATRLRLDWSTDRYRYQGTYHATQPEDYTNHNGGEGAWQRAEAVIEHRLDTHTRLSAGLDLQRDGRIRQLNRDALGTRIDDQRRGHFHGAFVQLEQAFTPALRLNAGLRVDHYSTFGRTASPRLGLIWQPTEGQAFKLLEGTAYRAPNAFELWFSDGGLAHVANPDLEPERVHSRELVWEARWSPRLQTTLSAYRNRLRGLIDQETVADPGLVRFRNAGGVDGTGLEAQVDAQLARGLEARVSASWQHSRTLDAAQPVSNSPRLLLKGSLVARLGRDATLALESRSTSGVYTITGERLPAYTLLNLTASSPLGASGWRGAVSLFNALDRAHVHPASSEHWSQVSLPQFGRLWSLKLEKAL